MTTAQGAPGGPPTTPPRACRFVVLAVPRTGSWNLVEMLRSHPNIAANGELLNPDDRGWWTRRDGLSELELLRLGFSEDPRRRKREVLAVGIKVLDVQVGQGSAHRGLLDRLAEDGELRVIILRRRNLAEALRSQMQAEQTGRWLARTGEDLVPPPKVRLSAAECWSFFRRAERFYDAVERRFALHRTLHVTYEDLCFDQRRQLERLQRFLGVPPCRLSGADVRKQEHRPLAETVENHAELRTAFEGTAYARFFA
jgi:hypothetical protein